jgi:hypothetical protein
MGEDCQHLGKVSKTFTEIVTVWKRELGRKYAN